MVGRIAPWKGQDVFVKAFAEAFPAGTEMASIVGAPLFGEDEYACSLVDLVERLGVSDRVIFRGFREDVASELDTADVLVHASTTPEPFGQVVIQGMAAGLAVIASDAGGPAEIVEHFRNGILVRPGDVGALASIMRLLAKDPMLRKSLGDRGRTTALNYSPEVVTARMLDVYRSIVGR
jgi:glycosyltransferase involved in cell wall biosynthesis